MKKFLLITLVCCLIVTPLSAFAVAENIIIDGETITIPAEMGKVCEVDDRTFVPVRFVTEYLGCTVVYQEEQQSATITDPKSEIYYFMMAGDDRLFVLPGAVVLMDTKVFINNEEGRMYVPVRFLAEALGYTVDWDDATQTVTLTSAK